MWILTKEQIVAVQRTNNGERHKWHGKTNTSFKSEKDEKSFVCFKAVNHPFEPQKEKECAFAQLKRKYPAAECNLFLFNFQSISIKS